MLLNQWKILDKEKKDNVLDILSTNKDSIVFSKDYTEVAIKELPFYHNYKLYKLTNYSTLPVFSMKYLSNGDDFYSLDGLANTIYTVNELDNISINRDNIVDYLAFFFNKVQGSEGDVYLIKDPNKIPESDTLSKPLVQEIIGKFNPITIEVLTGSKNIKVTATIIYGDALIDADMSIDGTGKISFDNQRLLLSGIALPTAIYNNYNSHVED